MRLWGGEARICVDELRLCVGVSMRPSVGFDASVAVHTAAHMPIRLFAPPVSRFPISVHEYPFPVCSRLFPATDLVGIQIV